MGICCGERNTSILEKQLNTIFESLPICNSSIDDFINYYEKKIQSNYFTPGNNNNVINDISYQELINVYLLPKGEEAEILNEYWFDFYNSMKFNERTLKIKFILCLFCKLKDTNKFTNTLIKLLEEFDFENKNDFILNNDFYLYKFEFIKILSLYIELITVMTIKHFKYFENDAEKFEKKKREEWQIEYIEPFIEKYFFENIDEETLKGNLLNINKFLNSNLKRIKDIIKVRENFSQFCLLKINELEKLNNSYDMNDDSII